MKGRLVFVDGLDGSGKSYAIRGLVRWANSNKLKVFDLREYESKNNRIPEFKEISDSDVIISCEPTLAWVGKIIKEELIRPKERLSYSGVTIAHAFALDREILYRRVIIPALEQGKIIFQERGVITSFVYQPVQIHTPLTELMNIPGNKLALKYAPSLIIICTVEPEYLMPRLEKRPSHDRQIFEHLSFQRKLYHRYKSDWLRELFAKYGSTFAYIDTNPPKTEEDTILAAKKVWEDYLAKL